jgi:glycosyltransferase involved in cell wall biosynthesis
MIMTHSEIRLSVQASEEESIERWSEIIRGKKFVWLLPPPWNNVWTRQNHFAIRLAKLGAEILYIENSASLISTLKQRKWNNLPLGKPLRDDAAFPRLHVIRPRLTLPGSMRSELIAWLNGQFIAQQVNRWAQEHHWASYHCWCRLPHSLFAMNALNPKRIIYDVTDDYELYQSNPRSRRLVREREDRMFARADLIFISSKELQERVARRGIKTIRIPNGVEYSIFAQAARPGNLHPLVAGMGKPVIGYVGLTSHWMDFELLEMLGRRWPGKVLMLGPIAAQVRSRAQSMPGIVWGGFVRQHELPPYLRGVDVWIMPHLVNELRRMSTPLKIWEYMATGKPFVSVDLPALEPVSHIVSIARNREHFLELVEQGLRACGDDRLQVGQDLAKTHSWDAMFARVMTQLEPFLTRT